MAVDERTIEAIAEHPERNEMKIVEIINPFSIHSFNEWIPFSL